MSAWFEGGGLACLCSMSVGQIGSKILCIGCTGKLFGTFVHFCGD